MPKAAKKVENAKGSELRVLEQKWGKAVISTGYTVLPTIVLRYQQRLKLKPLEINILLHLLSYWWQKDNLPHPGKNSLAVAVGVVPSTVRRCIKRLENAGYIQRIPRHTSRHGSTTNKYDFSGLIKALQPLAAEELEEISKRKARQIQRLKGKKPGLQLVK